MGVERKVARAVLLTTRDLALLDLLTRHVLLSFGQIQRLAFPLRDHSTVMNRLKRLEDAGYIHRQRIHRVRHPLLTGDAGVVFQITMRGICELQKLNPGRALPERMPSIHGRQIDHDLIVVEIAELLKLECPGTEYVNGSYLAHVRAGDPRPDGVLMSPATGHNTALEVELSMKSADRVREILASYRVRGSYEKVIYFVGSMAIGKRIASEVKGYSVTRLEDFQDKLFEIRLLPAGPERKSPVAAMFIEEAA